MLFESSTGSVKETPRKESSSREGCNPSMESLSGKDVQCAPENMTIHQERTTLAPYSQSESKKRIPTAYEVVGVTEEEDATNTRDVVTILNEYQKQVEDASDQCSLSSNQDDDSEKTISEEEPSPAPSRHSVVSAPHEEDNGNHISLMMTALPESEDDLSVLPHEAPKDVDVIDVNSDSPEKETQEIIDILTPSQNPARAVSLSIDDDPNEEAQATEKSTALHEASRSDITDSQFSIINITDCEDTPHCSPEGVLQDNQRKLGKGMSLDSQISIVSVSDNEESQCVPCARRDSEDDLDGSFEENNEQIHLYVASCIKNSQNEAKEEENLIDISSPSLSSQEECVVSMPPSQERRSLLPSQEKSLPPSQERESRFSQSQERRLLPPSQERQSISTPLQRKESLASPLLHRDSLTSPLQKRESLSTPLQHKNSLSTPLQHKNSLSTPLQHKSSPSTPLQHRDSLISPQDRKPLFSPSQDCKPSPNDEKKPFSSQPCSKLSSRVAVLLFPHP